MFASLSTDQHWYFIHQIFSPSQQTMGFQCKNGLLRCWWECVLRVARLLGVVFGWMVRWVRWVGQRTGWALSAGGWDATRATGASNRNSLTKRYTKF